MTEMAKYDKNTNGFIVLMITHNFVWQNVGDGKCRSEGKGDLRKREDKVGVRESAVRTKLGQGHSMSNHQRVVTHHFKFG